ncbi:Lipoxygenase [Cadophora sp. DSE1049]|nr:Lipoxygenase [Cadophora sp. DSE1049]
MAFGNIFSSFRSSSNLREKAAADSQVLPAPTFQIIKTPVIINTTPAVQPKLSSRWVKSLGNLKSRPRPSIPDFVSTEPTIESKVGLNVIKLFQDVDARFSSYFDLAEFEPSDREARRNRSIETLRRTYEWQEPGSTNPPYPPCLRSIPRDEQTGLLQIFNAERLIDTTVALLPEELQPKLLASSLYGQPVGKTMAGIEARMKRLTRANKNIGTEASVGNREDWYTDAVFAQQSFTGSNPTSIASAGAEWVGKFKGVAKTQGRTDIAILLEYARAESFFIQDCSYFREAANAAPAATLQSDDKKRFGCASVTLFQLREDGNLHPLAIIIDFKMSIEDSVVIFNKRLTPVDSTSTEEQDWPWRYAKMCSQVSDWTRHEIQVHLNDCHFVEEATIVAAQRSFTADHIVYRLLEPHWLKTLPLNASARSILVPKVVVEINGFSKAQTYAFLLNAYKRFNWTDHYIPADLERRGFPQSKLDDKAFHNYAWARNMVPMWNTLYNFVFSVLKTAYKTDADVEADKSVSSWCHEMHSPTGGQMASFPDIRTIDDLTNAVVMCIHTASPQHNSVNYLQCYYMAFVPNKPGCLNTPLPNTLEELMSYKEQDVVAALPVHDEQVWLLSSQLPYLLSYGVSEDQTLLSYAQELEDEARGEEGENWKAIETAAGNFYGDLMKLGVLFDEHSRVLDDKIVPYNVMDPTELAVSILI